MRGRRFTVELLILISFVLSTIAPMHSMMLIPCDSFSPSSRPTSIINSYTPSDPISITSNADFETQGWPGNGTSVDPYRITGLNITSNSVCISISDTDAHFVIGSCFLKNYNISFIDGILFYNVSNGCVISSTVISPTFAIEISHSDNSTLFNNTLLSSSSGIYIYESSNCVITNNTLYDGGLYIGSNEIDEWLHDVNNNTVNSKLIGYFWNTTNVIIDGNYYGQLILANSSNVTVQGGTFYNTFCCVTLAFSFNCTISDVDITGPKIAGVRLHFSSNNTLYNNTINDVDMYGIMLYQSSYCELNANEIRNANHGINSFTSYSNTYTNNTITECMYSLYSRNGGSSFLVNNSLLENSVGLYFMDELNCIIVNNTVCYNFNGVFLDWCENFQIYYNTIGWNTNNARDSGSHNIWDNGITTGNIWGDYRGPGVYDIPGTSSSVDNYPSLLRESDPPAIDTPADIEYTIGENGTDISWNVSDIAPSHYFLYRNEISLMSGYWDGSDIEVNVDSLGLGEYNYTLVIYDLSGNQANDTVVVLVTALEPTDTTPDSSGTSPDATLPIDEINPTTLIIVIISAAIIIFEILIAGLIHKKRNKKTPLWKSIEL